MVSGRAQIKVADEDPAVRAGAIVYAARNVEHRFHSIKEDLKVLVFPSINSGQASRQRSIH